MKSIRRSRYLNARSSFSNKNLSDTSSSLKIFLFNLVLKAEQEKSMVQIEAAQGEKIRDVIKYGNFMREVEKMGYKKFSPIPI